jgi:ATP-dependent DNA helicase RecG
MKPSLDKLHKYFKLEVERGYDNHAVVGGLERMLDFWEAEARADELPEELVQAVIARLRDYSRLTTKSRAETLEGLWRRIQRDIHDLPPISFTTPEAKKAPESNGAQSEFPSEETAAIEDQPPQAPTSRPGVSRRSTRQSPAQVSIPHPGEPAALSAPVNVLTGIGPRYAQTLSNIGIRTLRDLLYHFPRRYDDYTRLQTINRLRFGEEVTVIGVVQHISTRPLKSGKIRVTEAVISDGSGSLRVTWFNPWIAQSLESGAHVVLSGKTDQYLGRVVMNNPEWELLEQQQLSTNRIVPVYPLTAKITQRWLRQQMNQVVTYWAPRVEDPLPVDLRASAQLVDLPTALLQIHFPDSWDDLKKAQERLAFDEIFFLQLGVLRQKRAWQERTAQVFEADEHWLEGQIARLPFTLTGAQRRALADIRTDLQSGQPMNRLLQGDVGSGKTAVAALAIAMIVRHGAQAALMAPTSILAEQHYKNLLTILAGTEIAHTQSEESAAHPPLQASEIRLMVGATPEATKQEIRAGLADGAIKLVIGTHALIEDPVIFQKLQLIIVDEQHRFGVEQRAVLRAKGDNPHLLVMTATPIPRSLALTVYGDLDLSVMDEMPPGRQPVGTHVLTPRERERAYALIRSQIGQGRQAFIIYPLVEESETSDAKAAVEEQERLQTEIFPGLKVGLLHGRMRADEKDTTMAAFRDGEYHILVSTSVIEVGVDVPNATVMLIEGANRFGLAQLHQFRGRVGRGSDKAYCLLIPESPDEIENERLRVMTETNDGFALAERDLEQRGPGQFLGTRQSGYADLQLANLTDVHLIEKSRRQAQALFEQDLDLNMPEHQLLAAALHLSWGGGKGDVS